MTQRRFFKYLTRAHRWLGLLLGVQILIWFMSGFVMSFFDINQVRGQHIAQKVNFDLDRRGVLPLEQLALGSIQAAELMSAAGTPIYKITSNDDTQFFDARSGTPWQGITARSAAKAATLYYQGSANEPQYAKLIMLVIQRIYMRGRRITPKP